MFADQVAAKIDAVLAATGAAQVTVVGHSMGGLVARAYLAKHGGAKVRRVVTIGTPHHGSVFAYLRAWDVDCRNAARPTVVWGSATPW
jgi:triacylglycerol esterase/lipase EstA (alpha/beta hydrolase family)